MSWMENGRYKTVPIEEFFKAYEDCPPLKVSYSIRKCDVDENIATLTLDTQFGEIKYTDMFALVKDDKDWKFVSKVYRQLN